MVEKVATPRELWQVMLHEVSGIYYNKSKHVL